MDLAPGLPTMASAGLVGYESVSVYGLLAPSRTPASIVGRLNQETLTVVNVAEIKERFFNSAVEAVGSSPEELVASIKADIIRWDKVIKEVDIREDQDDVADRSGQGDTDRGHCCWERRCATSDQNRTG